MTIMNFISQHIIIVAIVVVIVFFIIQYLISSGYFKKIGLGFDKEEFKKTIQNMQGNEDFFAPSKVEETYDENKKSKKQEDFFDTSLNIN